MEVDAVDAVVVANLAAERDASGRRDHEALVGLANHLDFNIHVGRSVFQRLDDDLAQADNVVGVDHFKGKVERRRDVVEANLKRLVVDHLDGDVDRRTRFARQHVHAVGRT